MSDRSKHWFRLSPNETNVGPLENKYRYILAHNPNLLKSIDLKKANLVKFQPNSDLLYGVIAGHGHVFLSGSGR